MPLVAVMIPAALRNHPSPGSAENEYEGAVTKPEGARYGTVLVTDPAATVRTVVPLTTMQGLPLDEPYPLVVAPVKL